MRLFRLTSHDSDFVYNHTTPTAIYTLSLHDALPILTAMDRIALVGVAAGRQQAGVGEQARALLAIEGDAFERGPLGAGDPVDRKSTRLNSSHGYISYAVFCLKKKTTKWLARRWPSYV